MSTIITTNAESEIVHINELISKTNIYSKNVLELLNPDDKTTTGRNTEYISKTLTKMQTTCSELKQKDNSFVYGYTFGLRRDLKCRFASRSLLYKTGLDNRLYCGVQLTIIDAKT